MNKVYNQNTIFSFTSNTHNTILPTQLNNLNVTCQHSKTGLLMAEKSLVKSLFINLSDTDLLKSVNLNIINTLTLPITNKHTTVNNYTNILPLTKSEKLHFKK
jgi:hypothetical protein